MSERKGMRVCMRTCVRTHMFRKQNSGGEETWLGLSLGVKQVVESGAQLKGCVLPSHDKIS